MSDGTDVMHGISPKPALPVLGQAVKPNDVVCADIDGGSGDNFLYCVVLYCPSRGRRGVDSSLIAQRRKVLYRQVLNGHAGDVSAEGGIIHMPPIDNRPGRADVSGSAA